MGKMTELYVGMVKQVNVGADAEYEWVYKPVKVIETPKQYKLLEDDWRLLASAGTIIRKDVLEQACGVFGCINSPTVVLVEDSEQQAAKELASHISARLTNLSERIERILARNGRVSNYLRGNLNLLTQQLNETQSHL